MSEFKLLIIVALSYLFRFINFLILIRVILSWVSFSSIRSKQGNFIIRFVYSMTEPILAPIRKLLSGSAIGGGMGLDFSPMVAMLLMELILKLIIYI